MPRPDAYAFLARWYDVTAARALFPAYARLAGRCVERGYGRVLDFGCGTGRLARLLRERGIAVTGVDASPAMLARAAMHAREGDGLSLVLCDVPLPFSVRSFDAAVLSLILHESDREPEALLAEALRVAPVCLVLDWRMPERNLDLPAQALVHAVERLAGKRHYRRFRAFAAGGYLRGAALRAGLRVAQEEPVMGGAMVVADVMSGNASTPI